MYNVYSHIDSVNFGVVRGRPLADSGQYFPLDVTVAWDRRGFLVLISGNVLGIEEVVECDGFPCLNVWTSRDENVKGAIILFLEDELRAYI